MSTSLGEYVIIKKLSKCMITLNGEVTLSPRNIVEIIGQAMIHIVVREHTYVNNSVL